MVYATGTAELRALSLRLKEAGVEGQRLRRKLYKQMNDSVKPLAKEIRSPGHLTRYMPERYAGVLAADLAVTISKRLSGAHPAVEVRAKARRRERKVVLVDDGVLNHPVFAHGPRSTWHWVNGQTRGMRPGFFTDAVDDAAPDIRDQVLGAMSEVAREITDS